MTANIIIGIDPGVNTGMAVKDLRTGQYTSVCSCMIHEAMLSVLDAKEHIELFIIIEDARQRTWFGNTGKERAQGVGSIKRDCKIWEDFLTDNNIPFKMVKPSSGTTKWSLKTWQVSTGYKGKTNAHGRDAAILIHGINERNLKLI